MATEIQNNRPGWCREIETREDGSHYVIDVKLNKDGTMKYHEYNVYGETHTHVSGEIQTDGSITECGGHGDEKRPWHW